MRTPHSLPALSLGILILGLGLAAVAGRAGAMVLVDYAFDSTNTTLNITSPAAVSIPPQGTLSGDIQVTYSSDPLGNIIDGPARLDVLNLQANLNVSTMVFGQALGLTGPANAELVDPVDGSLTGNQLSFGNTLGSFHAFGTITCSGVICTTIHLPPGTPTDFDGTASVTLPTFTVGSLHGDITGLTFAIGSVDVVASLVFNAQETGRTIPEPAALSLAALAAGALVLRHRRV